MDNRSIKLISLILAILLVNTGFVLSLSVSTPYHKNNPLVMYPGQEREILFNLQNCPSLSATCDKKPLKVTVSLDDGKEIAEILSGKDYTVDYGTSNTNIKLNVKIPTSTSVGADYLIRFTIASVPEDNAGAVQLGLKYNVEFPVLIKDQSDVPIIPANISNPLNQGNNFGFMLIVILLIILLVVIAILYLIIQRKRQI